jgi:hypothetical protein
MAYHLALKGGSPVRTRPFTSWMDEILEIARSASLWVVEDCAHAHGSRWGDRGVGTLGHIGSFSSRSFRPPFSWPSSSGWGTSSRRRPRA